MTYPNDPGRPDDPYRSEDPFGPEHREPHNGHDPDGIDDLEEIDELEEVGDDAPPAAPPIRPLEPGPDRLPPFSFSSAFAFGWACMKRNYGPLLGGSAAFAGLTVVINIVVSIAEELIGLPALGLPAQLLIHAQLAAGLTYLGITAARGYQVDFGELFRGFSDGRRYWSIAGVQGLLLLLALAVVAPFAAILAVLAYTAPPGGPMSTGMILAIVLLVPAWLLLMYLMMRFTFAMIIVIDQPVMPQMGVIDAMRTSWALTADWRWLQLLLLGFLLGLILIATLAACLLPALFLGGPLAVAVWGSAYAMIVEQQLRGRCRRCGYNLAGLPGGQCPECGEPISAHA